MKKIIIIFIIIGLTVGGYFYYTKRIIPNNLITSFCESLEYDGPESFKFSDLLLSDLDVIPLKSWKEYYNESKDKFSDLSKEKLFQIWKKVYMARSADYVDVSIDYPNVFFMTREVFVKTYSKFSFSHFDIEHKEYSDNRLECNGYVDVKFKGSYLGDLKFSGNHKFSIIAKNGSLGWKVIMFSIDY